MPEKTLFFFRSEKIAEVVDCIIPSFQPHQSVPKIPTCVGHFHLTKGDEISVHFRNCWMDFDICCFELASLDVLISADSRFSSLLAERYGIRLRNESAGAKKHRIVSREKKSFFRTPKKRHFFGRQFFGVRKIGAFSDSQPDVGDHPESTV